MVIISYHNMYVLLLSFYFYVAPYFMTSHSIEATLNFLNFVIMIIINIIAGSIKNFGINI